MTTATQTRSSASGFTRERIGLGVIDLGVVAGLVTYGHLHHGGEPLADPLSAILSVLPFLVGWGIASLLAGLYDRDVYATPARAARITAVCWIAAANIGLILRSSPAFDGGAAFPFNLVITGVGLVAFLLWRVGFAASR